MLSKTLITLVFAAAVDFSCKDSGPTTESGVQGKQNENSRIETCEKPALKKKDSKKLFEKSGVVTQEQWFRVMGTDSGGFSMRNACSKDFMSCQRDNVDIDRCPTYPVVKVSQRDADSFIKILNDLDDGFFYKRTSEITSDKGFTITRREGLEIDPGEPLFGD